MYGLIYNDEYPNIDANLTDCNMGGRKERNIRDNIFVINAIMNSIKHKKDDFQLYDIDKCFDTFWLHEVINCLYMVLTKSMSLLHRLFSHLRTCGKFLLIHVHFEICLLN